LEKVKGKEGKGKARPIKAEGGRGEPGQSFSLPTKEKTDNHEGKEYKA
jgi:hypothetical protein